MRSGDCDVAVGSRFVSGEGYEPYRYAPEGVRRKLGTGLLRRGMHVALGRPFHDATSGLYAAYAKALPMLAQPYTSGAPEVEAILRLDRNGLRVLEVPVDMRERASGESKLRGKKALLLVLTVVGTLLGRAPTAPWPLTRRASSPCSATPGAATRSSTTSACSGSGGRSPSRCRPMPSSSRGAAAPAAAARPR